MFSTSGLSLLAPADLDVRCGQQAAWHRSDSGRQGTSPSSSSPPTPEAAGESRKVVAIQPALFLRALWTSQGHKHTQICRVKRAVPFAKHSSAHPPL